MSAGGGADVLVGARELAFPGGGTRDVEGWIAPPGLTVRSAADGRFELRGWADEPGRFRLQARKWGWQPLPPSPVSWGVQRARLVLARCATLAGSAILDPRVPAREILIEIEHGRPRAFGDALARRERTTLLVGPDGGFEVSWLVPGACTLRVFHRPGPHVPTPGAVVEIGGIELTPGVTNRPEAVAAIDLARAWRVVRLRAAVARGARDHGRGARGGRGVLHRAYTARSLREDRWGANGQPPPLVPKRGHALPLQPLQVAPRYQSQERTRPFPAGPFFFVAGKLGGVTRAAIDPAISPCLPSTVSDIRGAADTGCNHRRRVPV
ncbi:MAG: hypothetical protein CMJ84_14680, partial [Planctomycetes bacterium]|nr:hypothetical protein [Planctomycetota bacterium]